MKIQKYETPSKDELLNIFEYVNGSLYWKNSKKGVKKNKLAGHLDKAGYIRVAYKGRKFLVHRLIYAMHNGSVPKFLDHINCNRNDNRIENLRPATHEQNLQNQLTPKNSTSKVKGVNWNKNINKWLVRLCVNKKRIFCGYFDNFDDAVEVAKNKRIQEHKEFARV